MKSMRVLCDLLSIGKIIGDRRKACCRCLGQLFWRGQPTFLCALNYLAYCDNKNFLSAARYEECDTVDLCSTARMSMSTWIVAAEYHALQCGAAQPRAAECSTDLMYPIVLCCFAMARVIVAYTDDGVAPCSPAEHAKASGGER